MLGLVGGGGSILAVPVLVYLLDQPVKDATTESLLVVGAAAAVGALGYARSGRVQSRTALVFASAGAAGAVAGTALNRAIGEEALLLAFAVLLLVGAGSMAFRSAVPHSRPHPSIVRGFVVGIGTGVLTGFFGVGGGVVIVPALVLVLGVPMSLAVGTSLVIIALTSAVAFAAHLSSGSIDWTVALCFAAGAVPGAVLGRRVGERVEPRRIGRLFAALMVAVAVFLVAENAPLA